MVLLSNIIHMALGPLLFILFFFMLCPHKALADVRYSHITAGNQGLLYVDFFRFAETGGHVQLNASRIHFVSSSPSTSKNLNLSQIGFFLIPDWKKISDTIENSTCMLHSNFTRTLFTLDMLKHGDASQFNIVFSEIYAGPYSLNFQNCLDDHEVRVSMDIKSSMYHTTPTGGRSYLSNSMNGLSWIYSFFFVMYLLLAVIWAYILFIDFCKSKSSVNRIHLLMLLVFSLKAYSLLSQVLYEFYISRTGCAQCSLSIFLMFTAGFFSEAPVWTLLILIATGWSSLKPYLLLKEKSLVFTVIALYLLINGSKVYVHQCGPSQIACAPCVEPYSRGKYAEYAMYFSPFGALYQVLALLIAMGFSANFLRQCASAHGKASASLFIFSKFHSFLSLVASYNAYAVGISYAEVFDENYRYVCLLALLRELGSFGFYVCIGYKFRPEMHTTKIFGIDEDVEQAAFDVLMDRSSNYLPLHSVFCC